MTYTALSTLDSRNLCALVFVLSDFTLDSEFWHSLYPRLCTLVFCILTHSSLSHSLYSRVCTLTLHSQTVLTSCTVLPLDSVPLHSLHSRLCTLDFVLSHRTLVSAPRTVTSSCTLLLFLDSAPLALYALYALSTLCTFTLFALSTLHSRTVLLSCTALCSLLWTQCPWHSRSLYSRLCTHATVLSHCNDTLSQSPHSRLWILAISALSSLYFQISLSTLNSGTLCTLDSAPSCFAF